MRVFKLFVLGILLFSGISCEKEPLPEETDHIATVANDTGDEYDEIDDKVEPEADSN